MVTARLRRRAQREVNEVRQTLYRTYLLYDSRVRRRVRVVCVYTSTAPATLTSDMCGVAHGVALAHGVASCCICHRWWLPLRGCLPSKAPGIELGLISIDEADLALPLRIRRLEVLAQGAVDGGMQLESLEGSAAVH